MAIYHTLGMFFTNRLKQTEENYRTEIPHERDITALQIIQKKKPNNYYYSFLHCLLQLIKKYLSIN